MSCRGELAPWLVGGNGDTFGSGPGASGGS